MQKKLQETSSLDSPSTVVSSQHQFFDFTIQTKHSKLPLNDDYQYTWKSPKRKDSIIIRSNQTCEICCQFISLSKNILKCIYCNIVCHFQCFEKHYSYNLLIDKDHWICYYCQDSLQYDKNYYEQIQLLKNSHSLFHESQMKICKNWKRYQQQKKYLRIYSCIVKLQIRFRIHRKKKAFLLSIQNKLRTIKIKIHSIMNILLQDRDLESTTTTNGNNNSNHHSSLSSLKPVIITSKGKKKRDNQIYFIISVYGNITGNGNQTDEMEEFERIIPLQSWRIDSDTISVEGFLNTPIDLTIDEKFVLGGVSGFQTIIITLFQKNFYNNGRDIFLGQTAVDLSRGYTWKSGGKYSEIPLEDYQFDVIDPVSINPMKIDLHFFEHHFPSQVFEPASNHPRYYEQQNIPVFLRKPLRRRVNGSISFEVITTNTMNAECCSCYGSCIEELIRELGRLPDTTGFLIANKKLLNTGHTLKSLNIIKSHQERDNPPPSNNSEAPRRSSEPTLFATTSSHEAKLQPTTGNHHLPQFRMKKMWISISDGKLYIFSHFGEQVKLILDLHYFSISFDFQSIEKNCKGRNQIPTIGKNNNHNQNNSNVIYKLHRMGSPEFHFYPCKEADIFPMKCAFLSSLRVAKGYSIGSMNNTNNNNNNNDGVSSTGNEKFDVNYLLEDLLALEILRTKRNAIKEAVISSSQASTPLTNRKTLTESRRGSRDPKSNNTQLPPITSPPPLNKTKSTRFQLEKDEISKSRKTINSVKPIHFQDLLHKANGSQHRPDIMSTHSQRFSRSRSRSRGVSSRTILTDDDKDDDDDDGDDDIRFDEENNSSFHDDLRYSRDDADLPSTSSKSAASLMKRAMTKSNKISKQKSHGKNISITTEQQSQHEGSLLKKDIDESILQHLNENQKKIYFSIVNDLEQKKSKLTDDIKTNLIEHLTLDEMVINEKYQKYGEHFIQHVMDKVTEHQIFNRQYHHHHLPTNNIN